MELVVVLGGGRRCRRSGQSPAATDEDSSTARHEVLFEDSRSHFVGPDPAPCSAGLPDCRTRSSWAGSLAWRSSSEMSITRCWSRATNHRLPSMRTGPSFERTRARWRQLRVGSTTDRSVRSADGSESFARHPGPLAAHHRDLQSRPRRASTERSDRASLRGRWCVDQGYGPIARTPNRSTVVVSKMPRHYPAECNHSIPIELLKLHGSLNWQVETRSHDPSFSDLFPRAGSQATILCVTDRVPNVGLSRRHGKRRWRLWPQIVPPVYGKQAVIASRFSELWSYAGERLRQPWIGSSFAGTRCRSQMFTPRKCWLGVFGITRASVTSRS